MAKAKPTFYIFHGENDFEIDQSVNKMREEMRVVDTAGLNLAEFDGQDTTAADVLSAVSVAPFLADRRLVIVRGFLTWITRKGAGDKGKKQVERLLDELPALPDWARLVFVEPKELKHKKLLDLAQNDPHGYVKMYSVGKNLSGWLMQRAKKEYDAELEPQAAHALSQVIGNDLRRADNELVKLVSYAEGQPITEDMVALLTPYTSDVIIWNLIDVIALGQGQQALMMLHTILSDKDTSAFQVWAALINQFRRMLLAKEHLSRGGNHADLAAAIGMKFVPKKLAGQIKPFTLEDLEMIYRKLLEYDMKIKTGGIKIEVALDVVVATIARK